MSDLRGRRDRRLGGVRGGRGGAEASCPRRSVADWSLPGRADAHVASILIAPAARSGDRGANERRFFIVGKEGVPADHFKELERGPVAKLQPEGRLEEEQERWAARRGRPARPEGRGGEGRRDADLRRRRRRHGRQARQGSNHPRPRRFAYAELVGAPGAAAEPRSPPRHWRRSPPAPPLAGGQAEGEGGGPSSPSPRRRRSPRSLGRGAGGRRGSRRGAAEAQEDAARMARRPEAEEEAGGCGRRAGRERRAAETPVLIHVPDPQLGAETANGETTDGGAPKKKRTRRGPRRSPAEEACGRQNGYGGGPRRRLGGADQQRPWRLRRHGRQNRW